jgi:flavin reductase (DIM6/NTAB) family NADH-FMN oxidoreductase RutF
VPIDGDSFRKLMRRWASGVTVITCRRGEHVHGMTASAFSSLSLDPPLCLVCVGTHHRTHQYLLEQTSFGIHFLDDTMQELSDRCAGFKGEEAHCLDDVPHHLGVTGAPILEGMLGWIECAVWKTHDGGDHTIFVGEIQAAGARDGSPLLWFNRSYHRLREP